MSLRESTDPWLLKALPVGSRRFTAFQLVRDALLRRATVGELIADAPVGEPDARFRRWLAGRPLPTDGGEPGCVVAVEEPWHIPDVAPDMMVAFVRDGDRFEDGALSLVSTAATDPDVTLVYWDDALRSQDGQLGAPRFRPGWSPELLMGAPYLHRSFAVRRGRLDELPAEALSPPPSGAAAADAWLWGLLLEARFAGSEVSHIPRVLAGVADRNDEPEPRVGNAFLERAGIDATMGPAGAITWKPRPWPRATIIVPTRHDRRHMESLLSSLTTCSHPDFEVVVVDNGEPSPANRAWYERWATALDLSVSWWEEPFNYSAVNNLGAAQAKGEHLLFLNDDAVPLHPSWMENLLGWLTLPEVGTVGGLLVDSRGRIDHAGIIVGLNSLAGHLFRNCWPDDSTIFGPPGWPRNVMAVTGACAAVRRSTFAEIGGFDERFILTGSDVMLGVAAVNAGYRNVCTPWSRLRHEERSTRGSLEPEADTRLTAKLLAPWLESGDPWYSPNLSLRNARPELRSRGEIRN